MILDWVEEQFALSCENSNLVKQWINGDTRLDAAAVFPVADGGVAFLALGLNYLLI